MAINWIQFTDDKLCTAEMNENIKMNAIEFEFRLSWIFIAAPVLLFLFLVLTLNRSECDHLLQIPTKGGQGTVINRRRPVAIKDKVCDVLRAQRWTLRIVITVDGVVFVRIQRRDAYYRNDPSKYGLDKIYGSGQPRWILLFHACGT